MEYLKNLLEEYKNGNISLDKAINELKNLPYKEMDFAKIDHHRHLRQGFPEVIFCSGKTNEQILEILKELKKKNSIVLATRATKENADFLLQKLHQCKYHEKAKIISYGVFPKLKTNNYVCIITAGTADIPVADESRIFLKAAGIQTKKIYDCGVAGIHRLFSNIDDILNASAIIVIAGMEGALASITGGIASCPVIAVPTSIGYGASFGGVSALLGMLNSCAPTVSVVNIDNGFGAAYSASMIVKQSER